MSERVLEILVICVPVFALIALGKVLQIRGAMSREHHRFINWLVYTFSLPALIFSAVAAQSLEHFFNRPLVVSSLAAVFVPLSLFYLMARVLRLKGGVAAVFVFSSFWANCAYIGFPLAERAYGSAGMETAAVYNALVMPVFLIAGMSIITGFSGGGKEAAAGRLLHVALNPIVLAAWAGLLTSVALSPFRDAGGVMNLPPAVMTAGKVVHGMLDLTGRMGLPLALLSIGCSLKRGALRHHRLPACLAITGKLILAPLTAWLIFKWFFPHADPTAMGVTVMLAGTPNAVASYVIMSRFGMEEDLVSSLLVISTLASAVTIPLWLLIVY